MSTHYDYFVIGAGSGGVRSSRIAASHGAKVGIAEGKHYGGTCVNVGCVPKKLYSYASEYSSHAKDAANFGWSFGFFFSTPPSNPFFFFFFLNLKFKLIQFLPFFSCELKRGVWGKRVNIGWWRGH